MEQLMARDGASAAARACVPAAVPIEAAARDALKAYLRILTSDEDATLDRVLAVAIAHGEAFTARLWITRAVSETLPATAAWTRLGATPVRAITAMEGASGFAPAATLPVDAYAIDLDAAGDGWVRLVASGAATRLRIGYQAGLAANWPSLPEPLQQGAIRLASHLFAHRDAADEGVPPAAIVALWRPWRRMRLA